MEDIIFIFVLLCIYQLKHFISDYPLQIPFMLGKFKPDWSFVKPLSAHAGVHAWFTYCISLVVLLKVPGGFVIALGFSLFDFVIHFLMDRIKAGPKYLGRFNDMQKPYFWWALGLDQMVHHFTHYFIIYNLWKYWKDV